MTEPTDPQPYMHPDYLAEVSKSYPTAGALIVWQTREIGQLRAAAWQPIDTAPRDGTEIIARDADGNLSLVAWSSGPASEGWYSHGTDEYDPGWYRRAEGDWDLFDGFGPQLIEPVRWFQISKDTAPT